MKFLQFKQTDNSNFEKRVMEDELQNSEHAN